MSLFAFLYLYFAYFLTNIPKKRKRGAGLGNRKKRNIKDRSYVRQTVDGVPICMKDNYN